MTVTNIDHKEVLRGREAQAVLDNEAFKLAMESMKASVQEQWKACPIRDREGQVLLLQLAKLTDKFEAMLVGMVQSGNFAQRKIDLDRERDEPKARQFFRKVIG
jgi:hypothetical protein